MFRYGSPNQLFSDVEDQSNFSANYPKPEEAYCCKPYFTFVFGPEGDSKGVGYGKLHNLTCDFCVGCFGGYALYKNRLILGK